MINNGHRDFVYASRSKSLKLRYLVRLYAKELVMHNFVGLPADQLLERMVELSLRTEEHRKASKIYKGDKGFDYVPPTTALRGYCDWPNLKELDELARKLLG